MSCPVRKFKKKKTAKAWAKARRARGLKARVVKLKKGYKGTC